MSIMSEDRHTQSSGWVDWPMIFTVRIMVIDSSLKAQLSFFLLLLS